MPGRDVGGEARAFVALGGNLGDRLATLRSAARALDSGLVPATRLLAISSVYETRPVGPSTEPFLNAVVELRTELGPDGLLAELLALEARHGRTRQQPWGARTLDLDLLVYQRRHGAAWQDVFARTERLGLPHPRATERDFVLVPLAELAGDEPLLSGRTPRRWLAALDSSALTVLRRLEEPLVGARA